MSGHKYELQKGLLREIRSKIAPQSIANRCGVVQFVRQSDQQSVVRFPGLIVRGAMYGGLKLRVGQSGRFCEVVHAEATTRRRCGSVRSRAVEKPLAAAPSNALGPSRRRFGDKHPAAVGPGQEFGNV
jgi:hypothetical protein